MTGRDRPVCDCSEPCACYAEGYAASKDKADFEVLASVDVLPHANGCACQPCQVKRTCLQKAMTLLAKTSPGRFRLLVAYGTKVHLAKGRDIRYKQTKPSDVVQAGSCEDLAIESAALNPNLEFHCEARRQGGGSDSADVQNTRAATEQGYLVQYNLENGLYSVDLVSGDMEQREQMAAQLRQETPETTVLCQEEVQSNKYDRYGAVLLRVGEQYFVGGIHDNETRGKLITEDDIETVIEHPNCM